MLNVSFKSLNYPISPYKVNTNNGDLMIREAKPTEYGKVAKFIVNTAIESHDSFRAAVGNDEGKKSRLINYYVNDFKKIGKDPDTTILVAQTQKKEIEAAFVMQPFNAYEDLGVIDTKTGHLPCCYVNKNFRNSSLGSNMLNKMIDTAGKSFTDLFLEADNKAIKFYEKNGFNKLNSLNNETLEKLSKVVLNSRTDRDTITLMSKSLDAKDSWISRLNDLINNSY